MRRLPCANLVGGMGGRDMEKWGNGGLIRVESCGRRLGTGRAPPFAFSGKKRLRSCTRAAAPKPPQLLCSGLWPLGAGLLERWVCALRCGRQGKAAGHGGSRKGEGGRPRRPTARCRLRRGQAGFLFCLLLLWGFVTVAPRAGHRLHDASSLDFGPNPRSSSFTSL